METKHEGLDKLRELIKEVNIAMLCTMHKDHMHSRPMGTADVDDEGCIWFFTNEFSEKADQIEANPHVCVCYSDPSKNTYLSVMGEAELSFDKQKMQELWNPLLKAWFPEGLEDPKISLLKVKAGSAEYWDSSSSKMVVFFQIVKAAITGKHTEGEHGKIDL